LLSLTRLLQLCTIIKQTYSLLGPINVSHFFTARVDVRKKLMIGKSRRYLADNFDFNETLSSFDFEQ